MADRIAAAAPVSAYLPKRPCKPARPMPMMSFHGVEDQLLPYQGGGKSSQIPFETWGADWAKRNGCAGKPKETQYKATVEQLKYAGCKAPVVLYRVHKNGHTWPGHPLGLDRATMIDYFSGKTTGKPFPLMVTLGLTPEQFADTILLSNQDIDASSMILAFFKQHSLNR
jgi:poly(3-hydroxybutyrate) depolymerase